MLNKAVTLEVDGLRIVGQLFLPGGGGGLLPSVCVCHGIPSGNPPDPDDGGYPSLAEKLCGEGFAVFIFNFRGTGASGGNLDMPGWTRDLEAAIDYLYALPEVDRSHLMLLGFSGGAAVSVYVAARDRRVSSVVACACPAEFTFSSIAEGPRAVVEHFRSIGAIREKGFPRSAGEWLKGFKLVSPVGYVAGIAPRPLLVVHGSNDETVELSHAYRLYERAGEPKQIIVIEGATHRLRQNDEAMTRVLGWLKSRCR
ncbi:MAG TPA: hypothetical protein DIT43_04025 [Dehalococcoidia bacterium]|nr:hypothetical protein [Dehalococcoidia bacterium]